MSNVALLLGLKSTSKAFPFIKRLPDWFDLEHYRAAYKLDLEGWINQLYLRQMAQGFLKPMTFTGVCDDFALPELQPSINAEPVKPLSTREAMLIVEAIKDKFEIPADVWCAPSIFDFTHLDTPSLLSWYQAGNDGSLYSEDDAFFVNRVGFPHFKNLLSVDLNVPDGILIAKFKQWLVGQRARSKAVRKSGFTKVLLRRWATNQILPYIDLSYWAKLRGVQIPHWLLGEALFPGKNEGDKVDRVRKTTEKSAKEAMSCNNLSAMASQLYIEVGKLLNLDAYYQKPVLDTKYQIDI